MGNHPSTLADSTGVPQAGAVLEHARGLAELAFGSFTQVSEFSQARHLALLPAESLELDLTDPEQRQFGDYELLELLGEGGMGVVYRARQISLDREVAVKLLSAGPWASRDFIARFEREAQNAARMQHPNIVTVYEVGNFEGLQFFSMRLVQGESLSSKLKRGEQQTPKAAAALMRTIAEAVGYAHSLGVLHLDLKPANVLLDEAGTPYVADFGLARRLENALAIENDEISGTPAYMAPEQAQVRAYKLTAATDIWGLGAILYELLTGHPPFRADTAEDTVKLVLEGQVRAPRRWLPTLPVDLEAIVLRCLSRDPGERYPNARALADDLARYVEGRPVQARPLNVVQRLARWAKREPKFATAAGCALAALLIGLVATTTQWRRADANARVAQTNAHVAEANAHTASERLWDSRDQSATREMESADGWKAAPLLLANVAEMEAQGQGVRATSARKRLGIIENANPKLIDVLPTPVDTSVLAFSPDGSSLAATPSVLDLRLFDLADGKQLWRRGFSDDPNDGWLPNPEHMEFDPRGHSILLSQARPRPGFPLPFGIFMARVDAHSGRWLPPPPIADPVLQATGYSMDGERAITFGQKTGVRFWRGDPWRVTRSVPTFPWIAWAGGVLFAPDMRSFALRGPDAYRIRLITTDTLRSFRELDPEDFGSQTAWAFSPDSRWLALGDSDGAVVVAKVGSGEIRRLSPQPLTGIRELVFSKDGRWLAAAAGKAGAYLWTWPEGRLVVRPFGADLQPERVRLDRAHLRVLASGSKGTASVWQIPETQFAADRGDAVPLGDRIATALVPPNQVGGGDAVAWQSDKGLLAHVAVQRVQLQRLPPAVLKHAQAAPIKPSTLRFDGRRLVTVDGNRVRLIDAGGETPLHAPFEFPQSPGFAELTEDGRTLVVSAGRVLYAYDVASRKPRFAPVTLANSPQHIELNPDGTNVVTTWFDHDASGRAEVAEAWDLRSGRRTGGPVRLRGAQDDLLFNVDGTRLLAWNFARVSLRDGHTLAAIAGPLADLQIAPHEVFKEGRALAVAFDPDGAVWVSLFRGENQEIVELCRYARDGTAHIVRTPYGMARISPQGDGSLLAIPMNNRTIIRLSGGSTRGFPDVRPDTLRAEVAVSADGRWIARAQRDGAVLFDARTQTRIAVLYAPLAAPDVVWQLAFSPDGDRLLARSIRNRLMVWNLHADSRPVLEIARELALRDIAPGVGGEQMRTAPSSAERVAMRAHDPGPLPSPSPAASQATKALSGGSIPPRDPHTPPELLDLTAHYTFGFAEVGRPSVLVAGDYGWLAPGVQRFLGVDYDLRGGVQLQDATGHLEGEHAGNPPAFSVAAPRPEVAAVDVLMVVNPAYSGVPHDIVTVTLRYADGGEATQRTARPPDSLQLSDLPKTLRIAAVGYDARAYTIRANRAVHVYAIRFPNPEPGRAVRTITFKAGKGSGAAAVVLAATIEPRPAAKIPE